MGVSNLFPSWNDRAACSFFEPTNDIFSLLTSPRFAAQMASAGSTGTAMSLLQPTHDLMRGPGAEDAVPILQFY